MVINNGNLKMAILDAMQGYWIEVNKKCTYHFAYTSKEPLEMAVSVNYAPTAICNVFFEDGTCFIEIQNTKYLLWLNDNPKTQRLELHSKKSKLKLARID